jgi:hypothetical protein
MDTPDCVTQSPVYKALQEISPDIDVDMSYMPDIATFWHPSTLTGFDAIKRLIRGLEYWNCTSMPRGSLCNRHVGALIDEFGQKNMFVRQYIAFSLITASKFTQGDADIMRDALINCPEISEIILTKPIKLEMMQLIAAFSDINITNCICDLTDQIMQLLVRIACASGNLKFLQHYQYNDRDTRMIYNTAVASRQAGCLEFIHSRGISWHNTALHPTRAIVSLYTNPQYGLLILLNQYKLMPLVEYGSLLDMLKIYIINHCIIPSEHLISIVFASYCVDSVHHMYHTYSADINKYISSVQNACVAKYVVSVVGPINFIAQIDEFDALSDEMAVYVLGIGFIPDINNIIYNAYKPAILRAFYDHDMVGDTDIDLGISQNVECVKLVQTHGYCITDKTFQHAVTNMNIECILYIYSLYPSWTAQIGIYTDICVVDDPILAVDECIKIGCTFHNDACSTAIKYSNVKLLAHMCNLGAILGDAIDTAIEYDDIRCAIYIVQIKRGHIPYIPIHNLNITQQYLRDTVYVQSLIA